MKWKFLSSFDRLEFISVNTGGDEELFKIADSILKGHPVVANFNNLDPKRANYMLSFLSGVVYALNGKAIQIRDRLFMFGSEEDFKDGSLNQYIEDIK